MDAAHRGQCFRSERGRVDPDRQMKHVQQPLVCVCVCVCVCVRARACVSVCVCVKGNVVKKKKTILSFVS